MARYTGAVCKLCRREGQKLFLKGERCYSDKCALSRRSYAPGQHGQNRKKVSEYGLQLRAKQKTRRFYGVLEGQFAKYFEMATKQQGMAGENLLRIWKAVSTISFTELAWLLPELKQDSWFVTVISPLTATKQTFHPSF